MDRRIGIACSAVALVVVVAAGLKGWKPRLTTRHEVITATPGLTALGAPSETRLMRGSRLCVAPVVLTSNTARAEFVVAAPRGTVNGATVDVTGRAGYRATGMLPPVVAAAGFVARAVRFSPPRRTVLDGHICLTNTGRHVLVVRGASDAQSITTSVTAVDGRTQPDNDVTLTLLEAEPRALPAILGSIVDQASGMTGGLVPAALVAVLLFSALVLTPIAIGAALLSGFTER